MTPTTPSETSGEGKDVVRDAIRGVEHATAEVGAKIQHAGEDFVKMVDDAVHHARDETTEALDVDGDGDVDSADAKAAVEKRASKCSVMCGRARRDASRRCDENQDFEDERCDSARVLFS